MAHVPTWITSIAAHRGGAGLWTENSLAAFSNALGQGIDFIETDVHLSQDGELVILHDALLDRTTTGNGPVGALRWNELKRIALRDTDGETIPHLSDVLAIVAPSAVDLRLEIKVSHDKSRYDGIEYRVAELLASNGMLERTLITSFHWEILTDFCSQAEPMGFIGLLSRSRLHQSGGVPGALRRLTDMGLSELALHESLLSEEAVGAAADLGVRLGAYGAHSAEQIARVLTARASTFTTDRPDIAVAMRQNFAARD